MTKAVDIKASAKKPSDEPIDQAVARLTALSGIEYDRVREDEAKKLRCRVTTLDDVVKKAREDAQIHTAVAAIADPEPWKEAVEGAALLNDLREVVEMFVILPRHAAIVLALWTLLTYCLDVFDLCPILLISSPTKRCGKTRLLEILRYFVRKAVRTGNISTSALFRYIEAARPTLLIDEVDTFAHLHEEMRNVLNTGYERSGLVIRSVPVGDGYEAGTFSTYCAKALALIDKTKLTDTILDRSVIINMRRRAKDEFVERLHNNKETADVFRPLAQKCLRWSIDNAATLAAADPEVSDELNDRAQDNWRPLLAIADAVGGDWPDDARKAALALSKANMDEEDIGVQLLADIRAIFALNKQGFVLTSGLVEALCDDKEKPWATLSKGDSMKDQQLAKLLKRFHIESKQISECGGKKGFRDTQFKAAFKRYLPPA